MAKAGAKKRVETNKQRLRVLQGIILAANVRLGLVASPPPFPPNYTSNKVAHFFRGTGGAHSFPISHSANGLHVEPLAWPDDDVCSILWML